MDGSRTWLVTGGTGSLGQAIAKKLLSQGERVRVYARNEHRHQELEQSIPRGERPRLSSLIGAVEDRRRLSLAMKGVTHLIHAAAQKIISLAEYNPWSCVQTNILGSYNVIECAIERGVEKACLVSTDKARAPSTLYGASKLCAERLWLGANRYLGATGGIFRAVAYGNVWGSRGSVLESFAKQAQFGHIELTDPEMTRFHITIDQAVNFVLEAMECAEPGTLWVPKIPSYKLGDLARAFMRVYGLRKEPVVTGRRPAEKLHEDLISENESCSVKESAVGWYILEPGKVHEKGGWSYNSGSNQWRLSVDRLEEEIRLWGSSSSPKPVPATTTT